MIYSTPPSGLHRDEVSTDIAAGNPYIKLAWFRKACPVDDFIQLAGFIS